MRIVCISDTHTYHEKVPMPEGDILIHAGDITSRGELFTVTKFDAWLSTLPYKHKIIIAGNHDFCFEKQRGQDLITQGTYLQDSSCIVEGIKIYGSPWQPEFFDWAFNLPRGEPLREKWSHIPSDTNILVTHGPPQGILDSVHGGTNRFDLGCKDLLERIDILPNLKLHVFGHIHSSYGMVHHGITYVNASICTESYQPSNKPIVIDI